MSGLKQDHFNLHWKSNLSDYVTAIAWSNEGRYLAASSAAGAILVFSSPSFDAITLQPDTGISVDSLAISQNGQFLAAGSQDGTVQIWRLGGHYPELITTLNNASGWIDQLAWNPAANQLAFSLGRYVQLWDAEVNDIIVTLPFAASTVLGMTWHPQGHYLALCGNHGIQVWNANDWDDDPQSIRIPSASVAIAWSGDGQYIADGNLDSTLTVLEWVLPESPWVMGGFPGKVRQLAWSQALSPIGHPLLATGSSNEIVVWERDADEAVGWTNRVLKGHRGVVQAIAFQPQSFLLASAGDDGRLCLWQDAQQLQVLQENSHGFSCLIWHPEGHQLAAGNKNGEIFIWL